MYIETLEKEPRAILEEYLRGLPAVSGPPPARIDLDRPPEEVRRELSARRPGDRLLLSGKLVAARDAAHLEWRRLIASGKAPPDYLRRYPVYYAGPSECPPGKITGSLGPTTAQRMDPYAEALFSRGLSLVTLAKGNRGEAFRKACRKYGGFYLGTPGGAAALQAEENVVSQEVLDYPELGMEAVRLLGVRELPAVLLIDDKGNSLY
jgi:fumarate hydratase class I